MEELWRMTAIELKPQIRKRTIGIKELTRYYLERIERYDRALNTISEINESALEQAQRLDSAKSDRDCALFGLPILVKDNIDVAGLHTTAGSLALSDNRAVTNAAVVENAIQAAALTIEAYCGPVLPPKLCV